MNYSCKVGMVGSFEMYITFKCYKGPLHRWLADKAQGKYDNWINNVKLHALILANIDIVSLLCDSRLQTHDSIFPIS